MVCGLRAPLAQTIFFSIFEQTSLNLFVVMKKIYWIGFALMALLAYGCSTVVESTQGQLIELPVPERIKGQKDVLKLRAEKIDTVRIAVIGLGGRGADAMRRLTRVPGTKIVAICDLYPEKVAQCNEWLVERQFAAPNGYSGDSTAWQEAIAQADVDLVYVVTAWDSHTPIAVAAMKAGKHVAIEVPAAMSVAECWDLVNTAEQTQKHCMMLENCIYDDFELMTLNMAQQGVFGEIVHVEGAYIHDLRGSFDVTKRKPEHLWRLDWNAAHKGDPYPTHGLGPVAQVLNIHRGDKMNHLVSMGTNQFGIKKMADETFPDSSKYKTMEIKANDHTSTLIMTEKGKTILVQHDVISPRPYSRIDQVSGTMGFAQKYPTPMIALQGEVDMGNGIKKSFNPHDYLNAEDYAAIVAQYRHPFQRELGAEAALKGGHGGMDYIMDYRLIYCLRNGLALDMDVYDAAEWSCLTELTELSIENNSAPVAIPDFTRGAWDRLQGLSFETIAN